MHQSTIQSSHERCQMFGLQPHQAPDLHRIEGSRLAELQLRNARLCAQALPLMEMLYEQLSHAQSMVLLTDASGVVLHSLGDAGFLARAQQIALAPGAQWAEATQGTNAVGTTLMTERPTVVNGAEHYLRSLQFLTCSAAPIFDHKGALLGVIDVSSDRRSYHPHTLALARISARMIENQWFNDRFSSNTRLHLHASPQRLGTLNEGVLALGEDGQLLGANRRALDLLNLPATALRRLDLTEIFGLNMDELQALSRSQPDTAMSLLLHGTVARGHPDTAPMLYGRLSPSSHPQWPLATRKADASTPVDSGGAPALILSTEDTLIELAPVADTSFSPLLPEPAAPTADALTLRASEMRMIRQTVHACQGNLALAARQLGIGRSTLYRKLKSPDAHS
ncbi:GAF domain-containing protein [Paucibacter sp. DJ1R-11]|uniref:sigma-54-dependent Fis family transcriptional regulator n=1 Tax=Paucibacter sp. DJ1R-11 TaxID=2893556 RepID=UPI0021E3F87E|nr:helix-turn-helix domain-containing protein [Paucibacter sp. DJ1R-11]MCV2365969.1 GAF domain-containing protein [Paucibacter sp. DJ1R-11]